MKITRKNNIILILITLLFFLIPITSQAVIETGKGNNITTSITPNNPKPGDMVKITLTGYGFDTNRSYFQWRNNGKEVSAGTGKSSLTFQLGKLGDSTKIQVIINYDRRIVADKLFYFEPADIDFVWETDTYTPPFYQGKARAVPGSNIKIQATPYMVNKQGVQEQNSNLDFSWSKDGKFLPDSSGKGKNILNIETSENSSQVKVTLKVSNISSQSSINRDLIIALDQPEIIFYEQKPLIGLNYLRPVAGNYDLYENEASFTAIPLYWKTADLKNTNYIWKINGLETKNNNGGKVLTVRQPDNSTGKNEISLEIKEGGGQNKTINKQFNIQFGNNLLKLNNAN